MTTLALAEKIGRLVAEIGDRVETKTEHHKVVHLVTVGKQVFVVTCEESAPEKREPAV